MLTKTETREQAKQARAKIDDRAQKDARIARNFLECFGLFDSVFCYASMGSEVSTQAILQHFVSQKSQILVPFTDKTYTMRGIPYRAGTAADKIGNTCAENEAPKENGQAALCVVPLLAFNRTLHRIGYGKGCYDRFFVTHPPCVKVGLAYDEQEFEFVPEPQDVPLDYIVTPTRVLEVTL